MHNSRQKRGGFQIFPGARRKGMTKTPKRAKTRQNAPKRDIRSWIHLPPADRPFQKFSFLGLVWYRFGLVWYRFEVIGPSSAIRRPSSVVRRLSSVVCRPSSVVRRPSSVVRPPHSVLERFPFSAFPLSALDWLVSAFRFCKHLRPLPCDFLGNENVNCCL